MAPPQIHERLAVVVITFNRRARLARTLLRLCALPERPSILVIDNGSTDGSAALVRRRFPQLGFIELPYNIGCAARNLGVQKVQAPYVAFCDDDSWWLPGTLHRAVEVLDAHPRIALLNARILVGSDQHEDPGCRMMAESPLPSENLPGPAILGFFACAAIVRRQAFLQVGGFEPRMFIGGEEALLALDLASRGWQLAYLPALLVRHRDDPVHDLPVRQRLMVRNALWVAWLRRPWRSALIESLHILRAARRHDALWPGLFDSLRGALWVARSRKVIAPELDAQCRRLMH